MNTMMMPSFGPVAVAAAGAGVPEVRAGFRELSQAEIALVSGGDSALERAKEKLRDIGSASIAIGGASMALGSGPFGALLVGFGAGLYLATSFC